MASGTENCDSETLELVKVLLEKEDIENIELVSTSNTEKGDGFMSDVKFLDVIGKNNKGEKCQYNLVIKSGKTNELFRQKVPARSLYENEIYMYETVVPTFQKLLRKNKEPPFEHIPKCFSTILEEEREYLALENLKKLGYDVHAKNKYMDNKHLRLTLDVYAKWHALSFVLKDQDRAKFDNLSSKLKKTQEEMCTSETNFFTQQEESICSLLEDARELDLLEKFKAKYSPLYENWYKELLINEPESVITHGDCWNNNFLFQYGPGDKLKENPIKVVLLDFQLTRLGSPIFDLSYHLFSTCSGKHMDNLRQLLDLYYASLAENIRQMGSDPEKLFPYSSLIEHWKKYHVFGFMMGIILIPAMLLEKADTIDFEDIIDLPEENFKEFGAKVKDKIKEKMEERIIPLIKHAVEYQL